MSHVFGFQKVLSEIVTQTYDKITIKRKIYFFMNLSEKLLYFKIVTRYNMTTKQKVTLHKKLENFLGI